MSVRGSSLQSPVSMSTMSSINYLRLEYEDPVLWDVQEENILKVIEKCRIDFEVDVLKRRISKLRKLSELSTGGRRHSFRPAAPPATCQVTCVTCEDPHTSQGQPLNRKLDRRFGQSFQLETPIAE